MGAELDEVGNGDGGLGTGDSGLGRAAITGGERSSALMASRPSPQSPVPSPLVAVASRYFFCELESDIEHSIVVCRIVCRQRRGHDRESPPHDPNELANCARG